MTLSPLRADGLVAAFVTDDVLDAADVHVARRLTALTEETDDRVALAVALAVRAVRLGSVCLDVRRVAAQLGRPELPWPDPDAWLAAIAASPLAGDPPVLRLLGDLLYLDRYWREEEQVCRDVLALLDTAPHPPASSGEPAAPAPDPARLFPGDTWREQRAAAEVALGRGLTVLTGGPGTGKTTTVARLLALFAEQAELAGRRPPRIALAAPTGKAAARLQEAVREQVAGLDAVDVRRLPELTAVTVHRLLGSRPETGARFRHHRTNRLPHDVIVVDETSMVSLTLMARLLEAVRPDVRLVLVGDPGQLASVEAGAVLDDLVRGLTARSRLSSVPPSTMGLATLSTTHRFGPSIGALAEAVRDADADEVIAVLRSGAQGVEWVTGDPAQALRPVLEVQARRLWEAATLGDGAAAAAALDDHRLLCAHRRGPVGVSHWNRLAQRWLAEITGESPGPPWYPGRPVLVTANDYGVGRRNGDTGVVVRDRDGALVAVFGDESLPPGRLAHVETVYAMTVHKSQGSQAEEVSVLLPDVDSRLLTRELLYTAITRAQQRVRVIGSEQSIRAAVARPAARASGLRQRLAAQA